ncbi:MAG: hypothetical protein QMB32_02170 [Burkholderiaceae bacterium]
MTGGRSARIQRHDQQRAHGVGIDQALPKAIGVLFGDLQHKVRTSRVTGKQLNQQYMVLFKTARYGQQCMAAWTAAAAPACNNRRV